MKAKKIATFRDKWFTTIEYEYRGHRYDVEYPNGNQVCCTPAHIQHRDAQDRIDKLIEAPAGQREPIDLDEIWEMMGW